MGWLIEFTNFLEIDKLIEEFNVLVYLSKF